ncbi:MAG: hypothetical protein Q7J29_02105 [Stagnimonas sp.]|nr:hypothetical protein [Stagnimonas sp.]
MARSNLKSSVVGSAATAEIAAQKSLRYGFTALLLFVAGGLTLEFLHLIKAPWYLESHLRRELWVLAHAHGALLALFNLIYAALLPRIVSAASAGAWLRWGAALVPAGFFLGGIGNSEGDPSLLIALTPIGALAVLIALALCVKAAWRKSA